MRWSFSFLYQQFRRYWPSWERYVQGRGKPTCFKRWRSYLLILLFSIVVVIYGTSHNPLFAAPDFLQQAQTLNAQGQQALIEGQPQVALDYWEEAETYYHQAQDDMGIWGSQLNQTKALQALGFYRQADKILSQLSKTIAVQPPSLLQTNIWLTYGHGLRLLGQLQSSQDYLEKALAIAATLEDHPHQQRGRPGSGHKHHRVRKGTEAPPGGILA